MRGRWDETCFYVLIDRETRSVRVAFDVHGRRHTGAVRLAPGLGVPGALKIMRTVQSQCEHCASFLAIYPDVADRVEAYRRGVEETQLMTKGWRPIAALPDFPLPPTDSPICRAGKVRAALRARRCELWRVVKWSTPAVPFDPTKGAS